MGKTDRKQCVVWVPQKITLEVICLFIDLFFIGLEFANKLFVHLVPDDRVPHWIYKHMPPWSGFFFLFDVGSIQNSCPFVYKANTLPAELSS